MVLISIVTDSSGFFGISDSSMSILHFHQPLVEVFRTFKSLFLNIAIVKASILHL